MAKSLFEELGGKYEWQGDYLIPCLTIPAEKEQPIGTWGQRHLDYLKQPQERFERLIEGMKQTTQGITERLKEENALEWTGRLNNIRACAREIVNEEIIFA